MTIPHLKMELSQMVEILRVKTSLSTLCDITGRHFCVKEVIQRIRSSFLQYVMFAILEFSANN